MEDKNTSLFSVYSSYRKLPNGGGGVIRHEKVKSHETSHELWPQHMYLKFLTPLTSSVENIVNLNVFSTFINQDT